MSVTSSEITRQLAEAVGAENLSAGAADTTAHALDFWPRGMLEARAEGWPMGPRWVVWPSAAAEVAQVLRIASAHGISVIPYGAGSSLTGGAAPREGGPWLVININRMCNILDLDEGSMVVQVQAGMVGVELEEQLNARGFSLGHIPTSLTTSTLGGWLATRSLGLLSSRFGGISDLCLGVAAALPDGQVVNTRIAPRRATGPDLMHVLLGSEGTLGFITAAHLRLHRLPQQRSFEAFRFAEVPAAVEALRRAIGQGVRPLVARIQQDPRWRREVDGKPPPTSGTATPIPVSPQHLLICAFEGPAELVEVEQTLMREQVERSGGTQLGPGPARRWWGQRFVGAFRLGPLLAEPGVFVDQVEVGASWTALPDLHRHLVRGLQDRGLTVYAVVEHARLEGACLTCSFWGRAKDNAAALKDYDGAWQLAADLSAKHGGELAQVYGGGRHRGALLRGKDRNRLAQLHALKRKLDPAGIMNPGVLETTP